MRIYEGYGFSIKPVYTVKENKVYDEKIKAYHVCKISAVSCFFLSLISIALGVVGIVLGWSLPAVVYILLFALGALSIVMSFVFTTKKTLHYRVGQVFEIPELNDLRNKIEKYNITKK